MNQWRCVRHKRLRDGWGLMDERRRARNLLMKKNDSNIKAVQRWFMNKVTYMDEPYIIDAEQAAAVMDDSLNTIVVARAGSGKTRTLVAKIVYLIVRCGVSSGEIMAFVFNANAAREINERLSQMRVDGKAIMTESENAKMGAKITQIATTFHAFTRKIVYEICGGKEKCGKILASEKERFVRMVVMNMMEETKWKKKILQFVKGAEEAQDNNLKVSEVELDGFTQMMTTFINRAQQKYLGGEVNLGRAAKDYLARRGYSDVHDESGVREEQFVKLGTECYRRYHWFLLDKEARIGLAANSKEPWIQDYGTDFNLIVSWASKLIASGRPEAVQLLANKKYILIDEYQDFSQLFLAAVKSIRNVAKDAKLFAVGDDWQAINRFAGSDVEFFRNFERYFSEGFRRYEITTNYRCDRAVVDTARKFMQGAMKEKGYFRAYSRKYGEVKVINPRETEVGYALVPYDLRVSVEDRILREATMRMGTVVVKKLMVQYMKTVVEIVRENLKACEIMILHRNNETNIGGASLAGFGEGLKWGLDRLGVLSEDEFGAKVRLMTMHKSKGLEAEVVIILEANEGVIPKMHPDTLLYGMFGETNEVALDDQKRLFYVAMTRAKRRLYIISEDGSRAGFVKYLGRGVGGCVALFTRLDGGWRH